MAGFDATNAAPLLLNARLMVMVVKAEPHSIITAAAFLARTFTTNDVLRKPADSPHADPIH